MTMTHAPLIQPETDADEAKRWLIVGAYRAGAREKAIARISGLSRTAVRQIILNYRQTGAPSLPKPMPRKVRERPVIEYDEEGNLADFDSDHEEPRSKPVKHKQRQISKPSKKVVRQPTTKDVISYVVDQMHRSPYTTVVNDTHDNLWPLLSQSHTSPVDSLSKDRDDASSSSSGASWTNSESNEGMTSLHTSPSSMFITLSPHHHDKQQQQQAALPPVHKYSQTIRGYEIWTHEDDMILMEHMLTHLKGDRWRELEAKLQGRHSARLCRERWSYLQSLLLKGINNVSSDDTEVVDQH